jgi:3,4-dihydroxy 2-butanone 4-phosphate synthase/GTP cyclohydrolase II
VTTCEELQLTDAGEHAAGQDHTPLDEVERAIKEIANGRPVVVVDDEDRENEGDIIFAASKATPELLAFTIRYARGLICVPMRGNDLDRLQMPQMTSQNTEHQGTAFTVSVDARTGTTTGISAADRAITITRLIDPEATHEDFVRPGHIFPLRYAEGGVLKRRGHTEAAVDLASLAGLAPAGVVCEIINDDGTMMRLPDLRKFADEHGLALITIEQLIEYRRRTERQVTRAARTRIPNSYGTWEAYGYRHDIDGTEHMALVYGNLGDGEDVLTRVHSECLTGDVFGSQRCDCGPQLNAAMAEIAKEGRGVVLYLRGHEGRGIGLLSKLRAYELQDSGADTVDANLELGLPVDAREYSVAAQLLADLGVRSVRLLTNNPDKLQDLASHGFGVTRVPLPPATTAYNLRYLTTKRDRLGHSIDLPNAPGNLPPDIPAAAGGRVD